MKIIDKLRAVNDTEIDRHIMEGRLDTITLQGELDMRVLKGEREGDVGQSKVKIKQSHNRPGQALRLPGDWGSQILWQSAHEGGKVVTLTHRPLLPLRKYSWYSFLCEGHSAVGRIMSMKNSSYTIQNRTRALRTCSVVPQTTVTPRAPNKQ